jgi:chemotaxis protein CheZ
MSFQDLTGQRIKKIINIIGQMEEKITRMIISFGIKLSEKEKNPDISRADLQKAVDEKVELLAGPQRAGEGMNQAEIDALLANL